MIGNFLPRVLSVCCDGPIAHSAHSLLLLECLQGFSYLGAGDQTQRHKHEACHTV